MQAVRTREGSIAVYLEPQQWELFEQLLDAWRSRPREERQPFLYVVTMGANHVQGNGLNIQTPDGDIEAIRDEGLLTFDNDVFTITARNLALYQDWKEAHVEPVADVEQTIERYLDSAQFRARYPVAYARWKDAIELLWGEDSEQELSTIGHKCREAMQEFATELLALHGVECEQTDKAKTRERFSATVNSRRADLGERKSELLDALFGYWKATDSYIQRQEHGGQRAGDPLTPEDGRRAVFQTAMVMFEADRTL